MTDATTSRPRGRPPEKRQAILAGATSVFARDGFTRASIDAIATEAGVSTRTIYNHFTDKAELFLVVVQESAERVTEAQLAIMDRHLGNVVDLQGDLTAFAQDWVTPLPDAADHLALVRQIRAEGDHVPQAVLDTWHEVGPGRVQRALASRLQALADEGRLRVDDPERAALQLARLVAPPDRVRRGDAGADAEIAAFAAAGVETFLHGHLPRE